MHIHYSHGTVCLFVFIFPGVVQVHRFLNCHRIILIVKQSISQKETMAVINGAKSGLRVVAYLLHSQTERSIYRYPARYWHVSTTHAQKSNYRCPARHRHMQTTSVTSCSPPPPPPPRKHRRYISVGMEHEVA